MSIIFEELVFGPIYSRRLGKSLGINLLPQTHKICTFNCVYCECGWNPENTVEKTKLPKKEDFEKVLEKRLKEIAGTTEEPDSITFSGNGEPTLHPEFADIIDITIRLRNKYVPKAVISVLSNGTMLHKEEVFKALSKIDNNIMKIDAGSIDMIQNINMPNVKIDLNRYIQDLQRFNGKVIIQTLFLRGNHNGNRIDNTTEEEISLWIDYIKKIKPRKTMIYAIDRSTPEKDLKKLTVAELENIADNVRALGFEVECFG